MAFSLFIKSETDSFIIECNDTILESSSHEKLKLTLGQANFSIQEMARGFQLKLTSGEATLEDQSIEAGSKTELPSGREFRIEGKTFIASAKSERVEVSKNEDLKSWTARGLIAFILLFEILFITVLPKTFTGEDNFKREYLLEEISEELDLLRNRVQSHLKGHGKKSSMKSGILNDIKASLDDLANDLRLNPKSFKLDELEETSMKLSHCDKLIQKLAYSPILNGDNLSINKQALLDQIFTE